MTRKNLLDVEEAYRLDPDLGELLSAVEIMVCATELNNIFEARVRALFAAKTRKQLKKAIATLACSLDFQGDEDWGGYLLSELLPEHKGYGELTDAEFQRIHSVKGKVPGYKDLEGR